MDASKIANRAGAILNGDTSKYDNITVEMKNLSFEASIITKHMGDAFVINFNNKSKRAILDTRGYTKEKDFLDGLECSKDVIKYTSTTTQEEVKSKKIILFDDPMCFESVASTIEKDMVALFILLSDDAEIMEYYPVIKFEESKVYGKKFTFTLV